MKEAFDLVATKYDKTFTNTLVGINQRQSVYRFLEKLNLKNKAILELNCGTGEDAIFLTKMGSKVLATDISTKMLAVCRSKPEISQNKDIELIQLDINKLVSLETKEKYDIIFSNFGGMNCLSDNELKEFAINSPKYLQKNGSIVMVIMAKFCLWEVFYYLLKFDFKKALRRFKKDGLMVNLGDGKVRTYYYSPGKIKHFFKNYQTRKIELVNFLVPPSYLNSFFEKHPRLLEFFAKTDTILKRFSLLGKFSDHFLIELQLKKNNKTWGK